MSQGSYSSSRMCRCGVVANHFTAWTPLNAGRRFYKCAKNGIESCGYWEWEDEMLPDRAVNVIRNLKMSLESVTSQNNKLKEKLVAMDVKGRNLEDKVTRMKMVIIISWAMFVGFFAAWSLK